MKYEGPSIVTDLQCGQDVYTIEKDVPVLARIVETESVGTTGAPSVRYRLNLFTNKWFTGQELFASASDCKDDFESKVDAL